VNEARRVRPQRYRYGAAAIVEANERGVTPTNEPLETNVPGIWPVGAVDKRRAFTHTS
jgi:pyruvate/2-oxoglutarate dehydrogenase complex dihydrolipoamide dehydrogenase (E3) component